MEILVLDHEPVESSTEQLAPHPKPSGTGAAPISRLERLDTLWLMLVGQTCNLSCAGCYVGSHPENDRLAFMSFDDVRRHCEEAYRMGVRRIVITGGEPLLHSNFTEIVNVARHYAPTVVLTNATLLTPHHLFRLKHVDDGLFPVDFHVSLDGSDAATHDRVRGAGMFYRALAGIELLTDYGMIPVVRIVKTWSALEDAVVLSGYRQLLKEVGLASAKIRVQPHFPAYREDALVALPDASEPQTLLCNTSRVVSSAGVHVCPMRVDRWLGSSLKDAETDVELAHAACQVCRSAGSSVGI